MLTTLFIDPTPGLLVQWAAFLGTLHWPAGGVDLGVGDISYVELPILYELWAGERLSLGLSLGIFVLRAQFRCRLFLLVQAYIWRSCRFIGALMRSLCLLPGGLARFVPCFIGANHCRLRRSVVMVLLLCLVKARLVLS